MERQLDLSSVAVRLRGRPFTASVLVYGLLELGEFPTEPVTSEAHPYSPQVRARRRFHYRLSVQGRVVAVLGQHLQQCSFHSSVRARRTFHDQRPVQSRVVAVQGQYLQLCSSSSSSVV
ncbi:hypothetical protein Taro_023495 [Colocasia esculenta]|uniref:Uncharacterized protein n=1 Tax=Colocasia esculenta TaxID=4460 RepID=A0A843VEP0_COLES|nr:hypothetical protein [Colocasia esculenta]